MCGITGYINIKTQPLEDSSTIIKMLQVQKHRGPDDSGIHTFSLKTGNTIELSARDPQPIDTDFDGFLGFNRLSILDLSVNGHQPMASNDQKVLLAFNGEIYNAFDYKKELTDWGYHFKSTTDTEIVLALYLKYGFEEMISRLNGMFAIVITDLRKGMLLIARDRFGIKPMYYISNGNVLAFSSELKSFKYLHGFSYRLDEKQLDEHLLFRNNLLGTLFKDIYSLEPGYYLTYTHNDGLKKIRYFDINDYSRTKNHNYEIQSYEKRLESWLDKSVQSELMSDVKLGCQLSGGVDSSLVTYFANRNSQKNQFESISIVFNNPHFSEEKYINRVTEQLNIKTHKFLLNSTYYLQNIEKATWHFEAPINHPNTIGIYLLSQHAKDYVTVLLSGEGADEVFGGYRRYYDVCFPYWNTRLLSEIKNNLTHPRNLFSYLNATKRAVMSTAYMHPSIASKLRSGFNTLKAVESRISLYNSLSGSTFDKQVKYEMQTYLPDLLVRQDKMSMAHSIENRVPFLDNEVVANSFTIPQKYLLMRKRQEGCNTEKYLLKKMAAKLFDNDFAFRNKMGFGIPLKEYFGNAQFKQYLYDKLLPGIKQRGIMNHALIDKWVVNIPTLRYQEIESLWIAITFEIWASVYLDLNYENWDTSN
ncbi:MAG: asparagine synthase (glutamine-hydrolyzing) [Bacteroidetes bacterium]|nr:asparagine synthase (glutamine-hydrolyzing) [Bacteroidota bacterium]